MLYAHTVSFRFFVFLVLKPMKSVLLYLINYNSSSNTLIYLQWY